MGELGLGRGSRRKVEQSRVTYRYDRSVMPLDRCGLKVSFICSHGLMEVQETKMQQSA
jgi:hypothetical protein